MTNANSYYPKRETCFIVLVSFLSKPTNLGGDLELPPMQSDRWNYIEFSNDGLKTGVNPHKSIEFWRKIERKARELAKNLKKTGKHEEL